jgi:hypothetical protein
LLATKAESGLHFNAKKGDFNPPAPRRRLLNNL